MIDLDTKLAGPLFDGSAKRRVERADEQAERAIAEAGRDAVRARLGRVLREPTGFYASRITAVHYGGDGVTHDSGVVYGPWLEGESRRNRTTRFRGYHTFRVVGQQVQRDAARIAEPAYDRMARELS